MHSPPLSLSPITPVITQTPNKQTSSHASSAHKHAALNGINGSLPCNSLLGRMGISYNIIIGISWDIGFLTEGYHYPSCRLGWAWLWDRPAPSRTWHAKNSQVFLAEKPAIHIIRQVFIWWTTTFSYFPVVVTSLKANFSPTLCKHTYWKRAFYFTGWFTPPSNQL